MAGLVPRPASPQLAEHGFPTAEASGTTREIDAQNLAQDSTDGGLRGWVQCACSFILFFNSWGLINSFGAFQSYYETTYIPSSSPSSIAWIGSLQAFLLVAGCPLTGPLFDLGFARTLTIFGTIFTVAGMMLTSLATRYWELLLAQGLLIGCGYACLFIPSVAILPAYFSKHRMLALGLSNSGSSTGGIAYAIMFRRLEQSIGFGWAVRSIAFVMLASQLCAVAFLKQRSNAKPNATATRPHRRLWDSSALRELPFIGYGVAMFFAFAGLYIPFFFVQPYSQAHQTVPRNLQFYLLAFLNTGSFFGRIMPNVVADAIGPTNAAIPCIAITTALGFSWIAVHFEGSLIAFCLLYGFFSGAYVSLNSGIVTSLSPNLGILGTRMGMLSIPMASGLLVGTPIAGALEQAGWVGMQAFCGACLVLSLAFIIVTRVLRVGPALRRKV